MGFMQLSLKARIVAVSLAVYGLATAVLVAFQMVAARDQFTVVLGSQQKAMVENAAAGLDGQFAVARRGLATMALSVSPGMLHDPGAAQGLLTSRPALLSVFDDVVLLDASGRVVADIPVLKGRRGLDLSDREHIALTLSSRRSQISAPYTGRVTHVPSVAITMPVISNSGQLLGVISASVSLLKSNFLGRLAKERIGRSGYYFLVARGDRPVLIMHPDPERVMQPVTPAQPEAQRALRGWEGAEELADGKGVKLLLSFHSLREVDWVVAAALPSKEAYGPLTSLITRFVVSSIALAAPLAALLWFFLNRMLRSLDAARRLIDGLDRDAAQLDALESLPQDEVGRLVRGVAGAMRTRLKKEERLAARAHEDPLTGLPNLYLFRDRLIHALIRARRNKEKVGLLAIDLGRFKGLNEMRGHAAGDAVLREIAMRLRNSVRASDTVARLEGDDFMLILERLRRAGPEADAAVSAEAAGIAAAKVLAALREPFIHEGVPIKVSVSIGVALLRDDEGADALIARAQTAQHEAKEAGRNVWRLAADA